MPEDFNSLYERLVVRRTPKKKRVKRIAAVEEATEDKTLEKTSQNSEKTQEEIEVLPKESSAVVHTVVEKRREQQERDALVSKSVTRLRLARNLRGFARLSNNFSPHRLAFQICTSNEQEVQQFVERYKKLRRQRNIRQPLGSKERKFGVKHRTRLENIAARLYLKRLGTFHHGITTTVAEGKHRLVDELLFFSPPNTELQSQIGYAQASNVVPLPPQFCL